MFPSRPLTRDQLKALDAELLRRLAAHHVPIALQDLFGGSWAPAWALDASERLQIAGLVRESDSVQFELTAAGRARLAAEQTQ
jgi:hypothetical protein